VLRRMIRLPWSCGQASWAWMRVSTSLIYLEALAPKAGVGDACRILDQDGTRLADQRTGGQSTQVDGIVSKAFFPSPAVFSHSA
jgi:hypothetical protein